MLLLSTYPFGMMDVKSESINQSFSLSGRCIAQEGRGVGNFSWSHVAEYNMITNKQINKTFPVIPTTLVFHLRDFMTLD
jgi:hypothetical protein